MIFSSAKCLVALFLLYSFTLASASENSLTAVTLYNSGWSPKLRQYQQEVLSSIMSATQTQYGMVSLGYAEGVMSNERIAAELARGRHIHLDIYTAFNGREQSNNSYFVVPFPILKGLLGLRKVLVRKADEAKISTIDSVEKFRSLTAGQGVQWPDSDVYRNAGLRVALGKDYDNLIPMLAMGRFDFLPLSVIEIDSALREQAAYIDVLSIHKNIYIYYPIPVYLSISKKYPNLRDRVSKGFDSIQASGELQKIFDRYFTRYVENIPSQDGKLFILENPTFTSEQNLKMAKDIQETYFSSSGKSFQLFER